MTRRNLDFTLLFFLLSLKILARADFVYPNFDEVTGLIFQADSGTTNCGSNPENNYGEVQGNADLFDQRSSVLRGETTDLIFETTMQTNEEKYNKEVSERYAGFLHRSDTISAPKNCSVRARLTPSNPSKIGALWYRDGVPVNNGFETTFTFQISDHSKECTIRKDQYFSQMSYRTCSVRGGDGFAFVVHADPRLTNATGKNGGQMGFGGIRNSLSIAFDTWQNPGEDTLLVDHVSIQSRGIDENDGLEYGLLGTPKAHQLADGKVHLAKISYYGKIMPEYLNKLVASDSLLKYLKDNGEQKRVGTLVIWLDKGVETDEPIMAMPINLSLLLDLPDDKAIVGFTSSTGRAYEKHDILSWHWCDQQPCIAAVKSDFDYHQASAFSSTPLRKFEPGDGFGGAGGETQLEFPTHNANPDTTPWEEPPQHFSKGRTHGLADSSVDQFPPYTLYR